MTEAPHAAAMSQLAQGLSQFNIDISGIDDHRPLAVLLTDPDTQAVLGGISGRTSLGLLFIDLFYLPETLRGGGFGSTLLKMAEDEARRRGCRSAVLYTISFQAPGFYQRQGWSVFGEIPCQPSGSSRVFMRKDLS
ncbi:acetyltransferase family protein [Janthinobacterium agaricidamnosum NBRC 102515 = DSM 9628]|uniref:Acetyltransferase family protein n=2 Tax=Janthinobacterium agaricidamnosum TaxID=55508 RepID=W0V519_9BURK|nr:acetyltransferase family protein [Janthinobacterium agaricidamnosum NBRC 102515 = DSM 9628]